MTKKLAISLPDDLADRVKAAVEAGQAKSVSAYIARAIDAYMPRLPYDEFFEQWHQEYGPSSPEDIAWADRELRRVGIITDEPDAPAGDAQ